MLLIDFWYNKIEKNKKNIENVKKLYLIVKRDKRKRVINNFDFKIISI